MTLDSKSCLWDENRILKEFEDKDLLLDNLCEQVDPYTFYEDIFYDLEIEVPLRYIDPSGKVGVEKLQLIDAIEKAKGLSNVILSPCVYKNSYPKKALLQEIFAFVVDLDYVSARLLHKLLTNGWRDKNNRLMPVPSYIVNSGAGIHVYFCLNDVQIYPVDKNAFDELNKKLSVIISNLTGIKPDIRPVGQGFRVPGSLNKLGKPIKVYKYHSYIKWNIEYLSASVDLAAPKSMSNQEIARMQLIHQSTDILQTNYLLVERWPIPRKWYDSTKNRCIREVEEGHRYLSLMALTSIGYKCRVPLDEIEKDLHFLVEIYNKKKHQHIIKDEEVKYALKLYKPRATTTKSSTLEDWLGFKFKHMNRHGKDRFPRKKTDIMKAKGLKTNLEARAWEARDEKYPDGSWRKNAGRKSYKDKILNWITINPSGKPLECASETGINIKTVRKWWNSFK